MIIDDLQQQTPEWLAMRCGCVTGSRVEEVVRRLKVNSNGRKKGDYAKCREDYLNQIVVERLTGRTASKGIGNLEAVQWGIDNEPFARAAYEIETDLEVKEVGLAMHPTIEWFAASPDALVGKDGLLEIKCFASEKHLAILKSGDIPEENIPQMMAEMSCAEREWCDFVAFDPRFKDQYRALQKFTKRLSRGDTLEFNTVTQTVDSHIADMEASVRSFLEDVVLELGEYANYAAKAQQIAPGRSESVL